ncbi:heavy metal transporter [Streptomyces sp. NPDC001848]|uniref:heavy metal transporter n=1 Tax=Streptomyces sp. NPDC001848 TaxID=3364618 RepID=UPI0036878421
MAVGLGMVLALIGYLAVRYVHSTLVEQCTAHGTEGTTVTLDLDQAANAATIAAVATARGLPQRAVTVALATAMQESKLRDIDYGDRDSLGLFQQRPSQGWGTPAQVLDPVHASAKFYDALVKVPDYLSLPVTVAAQKVQHSGYPEAYAQHEQDATALAAALAGHEGAALSCQVRSVGTPGSARTGGTAVTAEVRREFGTDLVTDPPPAATTEITYQATDTTTGWALALWLVCHATKLHIASVDFEDREWNSSSSDKSWTSRTASSAPTGEVIARLAPAKA